MHILLVLVIIEALTVCSFAPLVPHRAKLAATERVRWNREGLCLDSGNLEGHADNRKGTSMTSLSLKKVLPYQILKACWDEKTMHPYKYCLVVALSFSCSVCRWPGYESTLQRPSCLFTTLRTRGAFLDHAERQKTKDQRSALRQVDIMITSAWCKDTAPFQTKLRRLGDS